MYNNFIDKNINIYLFLGPEKLTYTLGKIIDSLSKYRINV